MNERPQPDPNATPEAMLDRLRRHPEWDEREREDFLGRMVERFPAVPLMRAVRERLVDLGGPDADALLRLVEANPDQGILDALASAIESQPDLPPERAWEALAVLEDMGQLARHPALLDRWNDLLELLEEGDPIDQLIDQIEDDPEGVWLALQGLGAVERDVRPHIIAGLGGGSVGPRLLEFLRLLAHTKDIPTRDAAIQVLEEVEPEVPEAMDIWRDLAEHHHDPEVRAFAGQKLADASPSRELVRQEAGDLDVPGRRLIRSIVTAVDGKGRASIVLSSRDGERIHTAAFVCDVERGVVDILGEVNDGKSGGEVSFEDLAREARIETVTDAHELALGLLAGCLWLGGEEAPPALRYWIEATAGPTLQPRPFRADLPGWDPQSLSFEEAPARAQAILDACPGWIDDSPLTVEMAEELLLRDGANPPDPRKDAGAYRFLFEHGLKARLERYRRMLLWMAWFWQASGREELACSALGVAWELSDEQHVVPGHPFTVALTTRSLLAAQDRIREGISEV